MLPVMTRKYIYPIIKNFDYFDVDNFRTKKLEGAVELKKAKLPGVDSYFVSQKLYIDWKKGKNKLPTSLNKELIKVVSILVKKYSKITIRTCFRFSGYENPRSLPAFRDLITMEQVLNGIKKAYKVGEEFAKENNIDWYDLGLIIFGRVEAVRSGITIVDPEKSNLCVVEACFGDIHLIASGEDDFDSFWVNRKGEIVFKKIREKKNAYYCIRGEITKKSIEDKKLFFSQTLNDKEVKYLALNAFKAGDFHKSSVEIEYMVRKDGYIDMYELQERPGMHLEIPKEEIIDEFSLVRGVSVNAGKVEGVVKIVTKLKELNEVAPGEILVLPSNMMGKDIPIIGKIRALITDTGGITAHISTIAKECKIPCIVGTHDASKVLKNGMRVVVDATNGKVYSPSKTSKALKISTDIIWLDELKSNLSLIGTKAFNLMALMQVGVNVPEAFVITCDTFDKFLEENNIVKDLRKLLSKLDIKDLLKAEKIIYKRVMKGEINKKLEEDILTSFRRLKKEYGSVAVRSSATCEDSLKASFAGQFESFLFINRSEPLIESIKKCWASLYKTNAIIYANNNGIDIRKVKMAVIVQRMVDADLAGVMFTKNIKDKSNTILIEAAKGIGESVVSGEVTPVSYTVVKNTGRIIKKEGVDDTFLTNRNISTLTGIGIKIEENFGTPQDIEWAVENNKMFILQTRPITT